MLHEQLSTVLQNSGNTQLWHFVYSLQDQTDRMGPVLPENHPATSIGAEKRSKLRPLGYNTYWKIVKYDRKTKQGLKIIRVCRQSCKDCREYETVNKRLERARLALQEALDNAITNKIALEKAVGDLETQFAPLATSSVVSAQSTGNWQNHSCTQVWAFTQRRTVGGRLWKIYASNFRAVSPLLFAGTPTRHQKRTDAVRLNIWTIGFVEKVAGWQLSGFLKKFSPLWHCPQT